MKIAEIYPLLNEIAPFHLQQSWDNSGILLGSEQTDFERIYLSLDIDKDLLKSVKPNSLIITHHPLIFKGLKRLDYGLYPSSLIREMIKKEVSLISLHTNFDLAILNEYFVCEVLGFKISDRDEFILYSDVGIELNELIKLIKSKLKLDFLRVCGDKKHINRIAICTGSGGDLIANVKADLFITGDLKYHQALEATQNGLTLIDVGHFESERYFGDCLARHLQNIKIEVIITNSKNPFRYC